MVAVDSSEVVAGCNMAAADSSEVVEDCIVAAADSSVAAYIVHFAELEA